MRALSPLVSLSIIISVIVIYYYPTQSIHVIHEIPSNPHYDYYLILYPGEKVVGSLSKTPPHPINYIEIRGTIYDRWEPRLLSREAFKNCTFAKEAVYCRGEVKPYSNLHLEGDEVFNFNSTNALYLARANEGVDRDKSLLLYRAFLDDPRTAFFARYRTAVLNLDMVAFLSIYHDYPHRKEPLYYLTRYYRTMGNYSQCLLYGRAGMLVGSPVADDLYVEKPIYEYALEMEFAHCLF